MPRMMLPMPKVTITMAMNGRPIIGRKANRSISRATAMEPIMATTTPKKMPNENVTAAV